ncbi:hypothetical protein [Bradyrhizobium paxllaeri]|uniref:hypothetical protein n=1 Tax=Bradyrhizobium paxllaeri TaxID=190148 RepID=UPI001146A143|nr:hypothetical protein [Bradyrhizobium paxllaeri]
MYLASDDHYLDQSYTIDGNGSVCELLAGEVAREYRRDGTAEFVIDEFLAHLTDDKRPRPTGTALTGHGAEYCVQFGSKWLSTFKTTFLSGPVIQPCFQLGAAVFLNCCSSMRLGDSCVPQQYSLARTLFAAGSVVIGSFRNLHILPQYGEAFARALLAGQPLGHIVNNLNLQADALEQRGCAFQLLGDPCISYPANLSSSQVRPPTVASASTAPAGVCDLVSNVAWLEQFADTLLHWMPENQLVTGSYIRVTLLTSRAGCIAHATRVGALPANELSLAVQDLIEKLAKMRAELFEILTRFIRKEGWIQLRYAAHCCRGDTVRAICERCGGVSYVTCYQPLASHLLPIEREECDRCGTTKEHIGVECPPHTFLSRLSEDRFTINLSQLPEFAEGAIFFHRIPDFTAVPWPRTGGIISIPTARLTLRGRLTLVAAALAPQFVTLRYHTFFIDPKLDE